MKGGEDAPHLDLFLWTEEHHSRARLLCDRAMWRVGGCAGACSSKSLAVSTHMFPYGQSKCSNTTVPRRSFHTDGLFRFSTWLKGADPRQPHRLTYIYIVCYTRTHTHDERQVFLCSLSTAAVTFPFERRSRLHSLPWSVVSV